MFDLLEKLRQKPEGTRHTIAFAMAFFVSAIILVVWLTVIYPDWSNSQSLQAKVVAKSPSPWSAFIDNISNGASAIGSQIGAIKGVISSFSSTTPVYYSATSTDNMSVTSLGTSSLDSKTTSDVNKAQ